MAASRNDQVGRSDQINSCHCEEGQTTYIVILFARKMLPQTIGHSQDTQAC